MDSHKEVSEALYHARKLMEPVRKHTVTLAELDDVLAVMTQMKDGDGSQASHFQKVVDLYGVEGADANAKLANAKTIYDELNSALGNSGAMRQLLAILG